MRHWIAAIFLAFVSAANAAEPSPTASKVDAGYRIGPYPLSVTEGEIQGVFWSWLFFYPIIEGRSDPTYKLAIVAKIQVNNLPLLLNAYIAKNFSTDNCARMNIDNWVYAFNQPTLSILQGHTLRIRVDGNIETWTCLPPVFETVCEH